MRGGYLSWIVPFWWLSSLWHIGHLCSYWFLVDLLQLISKGSQGGDRWSQVSPHGPSRYHCQDISMAGVWEQVVCTSPPYCPTNPSSSSGRVETPQEKKILRQHVATFFGLTKFPDLRRSEGYPDVGLLLTCVLLHLLLWAMAISPTYPLLLWAMAISPTYPLLLWAMTISPTYLLQASLLGVRSPACPCPAHTVQRWTL